MVADAGRTSHEAARASLRTSRIIPHLLAVAALLAAMLSAAELAATPSWPTAFASHSAVSGCSGQPRLDVGVLHSAAPRFAHVVSAVPLRDGRVRAFWYEGERELGPDVAIWTSVYDAKTWAAPRVIVDAAATEKSVGVYVRKMGNPVVYRDAGGDLVMIFASVALGGWSGASLNMIRSADDGDVWSAPQRLVTTATFNLSTLVKGPPVPLEGGFWLVPSYQGLVQRIAEALLVDPAGRVIGRRRIGIGANQPQFAVIGRSHARAFMRAGESDRIRVSDTSDAGLSWSAMGSIALGSLDGPVAVASLGGGDLLMAHSARPKIAHHETGMTLSVSQDRGTRWRDLYHVDDALKVDGGMRYPWLMQTSDGLYHLFFTRVRDQGSDLIHAQFNSDWIAARGGPPCR